MKYLPCEFRQQLGAPIARASSVKTSNIGTLDALAGSVKQPFMQSAAKSDSEPSLPNCRAAAKVCFWETGKLSLEITGQIGPSTEVVALEYCFPKAGTRRDQRCVTSLTRTVRAQNLAHLF